MHMSAKLQLQEHLQQQDNYMKYLTVILILTMGVAGAQESLLEASPPMALEGSCTLNPREYVADVFRKREYKDKLNAVKKLASKKANELEAIRSRPRNYDPEVLELIAEQTEKLEIEIKEDQEDIEEMEIALQKYMRELNRCQVAE